MPSPIGQRVHVIGTTGSGKSTLGARLAAQFEVPFVELDALNWLPDWVGLADTDPAEFRRRIAGATAGDQWVVAGSYARHSTEVLWGRLDTVIWIDLPTSARPLACPASILAALEDPRIALGHQLRALLATTRRLAEGEVARLVGSDLA